MPKDFASTGLSKVELPLHTSPYLWYGIVFANESDHTPAIYGRVTTAEIKVRWYVKYQSIYSKYTIYLLLNTSAICYVLPFQLESSDNKTNA